MNVKNDPGFHGREVSRRQLGAWTLVLTRYEAGTVIPFHRHEEPYATVVLRGRYQERSGSAERECGPSNIVIHAAGERHCDTFAATPTACLNLYGGSFSTTSVIANPVGASIASKLHAEFARPDVFSSSIVEALMLESDALGRRCANDRGEPSWLRKVRAEVDARFREPLTLTGLAAAACVHRTHLARAFRQHYSVTLGEMIRQKRIDHSKTLLNSSIPLADIAGDAGFADQSHFTRTFRRLTGSTPAAFRREARQRRAERALHVARSA